MAARDRAAESGAARSSARTWRRSVKVVWMVATETTEDEDVVVAAVPVAVALAHVAAAVEASGAAMARPLRRQHSRIEDWRCRPAATEC